MHRAAWVLGAVVLVVAPLLLTVNPISAQLQQCVSPPGNPPGDFLTGGGFIVNATGTTGEKANFGVGGGCKQGGDGHGLWGHLEYIDHSIGLNVHWTTITAYMNDAGFLGDPNARIICGTARTNLYGDVNFAVRVADHGLPDNSDKFDIQLTDPTTSNGIVYTTFTSPIFVPHTLAGGNITLHQPNPSTMGSIGESCPALGMIL